MARQPMRRLQRAQSLPPDGAGALFFPPSIFPNRCQLRRALRQATDQSEAARRFLKWISGETSPTIYVSFGKKKREKVFAAWNVRSALIFLHRHGQSDLRARSRRRQRRTLLASQSPLPTETTTSLGLEENTPRGDCGAS